MEVPVCQSELGFLPLSLSLAFFLTFSIFLLPLHSKGECISVERSTVLLFFYLLLLSPGKCCLCFIGLSSVSELSSHT